MGELETHNVPLDLLAREIRHARMIAQGSEDAEDALGYLAANVAEAVLGPDEHDEFMRACVTQVSEGRPRKNLDGSVDADARCVYN